MENNTKSLESLLERVVEYGNTSFELAKLKILDKTSNVVSSIISSYFILILIASFALFLSLGFAFWLGEILGKIWLGFFIITAFYGIIVITFLFMYKWLKKIAGNYIIKKALK